MSYLIKIEKAVDYIEANLYSSISLTEVAEIAGFSPYHFHRIFRSLVGAPLGDYIRRRRLTNAAKSLVSSNLRIIDIALEHRFESEESFSRAFKKMFALTPGKYRRIKPKLSLIEKPILTRDMLFHLQDGLSLEPRTVVKEAFHIIGLRYYGLNNNNEIPQLWGRFARRVGEVSSRVNLRETLGVCEYVPDYTDESKFSYLASVEVSRLDPVPPGMVGKTLPKAEYAVFTHKGPIRKMPETYRYIHGTWLPRSDRELAESDDFELYGPRCTGPDDEKAEIEIYIPLK